jgi:hypothetical protein
LDTVMGNGALPVRCKPKLPLEVLAGEQEASEPESSPLESTAGESKPVSWAWGGDMLSGLRVARDALSRLTERRGGRWRRDWLLIASGVPLAAAWKPTTVCWLEKGLSMVLRVNWPLITRWHSWETLRRLGRAGWRAEHGRFAAGLGGNCGDHGRAPPAEARKTT